MRDIPTSSSDSTRFFRRMCGARAAGGGRGGDGGGPRKEPRTGPRKKPRNNAGGAHKAAAQPQGNQERGTAYTYVAQIKKRFEHEPQIYREFLSILQQYKDNHLDITSVKAKVASLFHRHTDLLHKFSIFLPEQESMDGEGAGDDADGGVLREIGVACTANRQKRAKALKEGKGVAASGKKRRRSDGDGSGEGR